MTPDLQTQIRSDDLTRKRANEISEESKGLTEGFRIWAGWELGFLRRTPILEIPELHEYLTDDADWDADTWDFEPEGRERLARTLGWLYERLPDAFVFAATWGPDTIDELDIDRAELLTVVESNAVSTGTHYKVRPA
jgi:hypothetical protein